MLISYHKPYKHIGLYCSFKRTKSVFKLGKRGPKPKFYDAYHKTQRRLVRESYYRKKLKEKGFPLGK